MADRTIVAGLAALAGILALALPVEALAGRGFVGGGAHIGVHRAVTPAFHRAVVRAPIRPAAHVTPRLHHRFGFRHRRGLDPAVDGSGLPYYGSFGGSYGGPYVPGNFVAAEDPASEDAPILRRIPACRAQDYVVPNRRGEPRHVTVVRC
jgi:hypothetical protein